MSTVVMISGEALPFFEAGSALQDILDSARKTAFEEEAHKLCMTVCGGYARTLELPSQMWADRFSLSLRPLLTARNVTLKAAREYCRPLYEPRGRT